MAGESARDEARRAREKSERLARRAEMFEKGADGEAATAAVLSGLPPMWSAIHDVRWPSRRLANIDHILVGPGGIFVIDSKNWSGHVTVEHDRLRQNGRSREKAVAGCADAGLAIAEIAGPYADRVFPVLCFVSEQPLTGWCRDVMICSTTTLGRMLTSRPIVLTPEHASDACTRLDAQLRAATTRASPQQSVGRGYGPWQSDGDRRTPRRRGRARHDSLDLRRSRPSASPRRSRSGHPANRGRSGFMRFVMAVAVLIALLEFSPQLTGVVAEVVAEQMTNRVGDSSVCDETARVAKGSEGGRAPLNAEGGPRSANGSGDIEPEPDC